MVALAHTTPVETPVRLVDRVTHPVFCAADQGGCGWYRCLLPARVVGGEVRYALEVTRHTLTQRTVAYHGIGPVTVLQRPAEPAVGQVARDLRSAGARVLVELDDNVAAMSYQNPLIRGWTKERVRALHGAIRVAHGMTVSTVPLAESLRHLNREIAVIPNAIDPIDFAPRAHPDDGVVRLGWAGSLTHVDDLKVALPALLDAARLPGVELHFFGYDPFAGHPATPGRRVHQGISYSYHGWAADLREHYARIACLDVAVAPLVPNAFNESKSAIKWLEHAFYGTAMVLSAARPYRDVVQHGETGLLARTPAEFGKYLKLLVGNAGVRREIGEAARAEVLANHLLVHRAPLWREAVRG